eukprot:7635151-Karenia_brevis.AAC.1
MGWQTQRCRGTLMVKDQDGDIWKPNPEYGMGVIRSMLEEARINLLLAEAAKHKKWFRHGAWP